eukprot:4054463-Amphidinium_carterae.1
MTFAMLGNLKNGIFGSALKITALASKSSLAACAAASQRKLCHLPARSDPTNSDIHQEHGLPLSPNG